ncbi:MAG: DNA (cytosine-5-)-methyltransferase [Rhodanobacter sp.]
MKTYDLLIRARQRMTQSAIAQRLGKSKRTIARWETKETECPRVYKAPLLDILGGAKMEKREAANFTFIDLFAGIGGTRLGFESAGGQCVFTSEWNKWSKITYLNHFGDHHPFVGDITKIDAGDIPDHDVLVGGFPCQPFSLAGVSKNNALGRPHGFESKTQGTLFFDIQRIIAAKKPKAFMLENVKNLLSHDKGKTWQIIKDVLENQLHYKIFPKVIDGKSWVPQHRERILIVGFREDTDFTWDDLRQPAEGPVIDSILHPQDGSEEPEGHFTEGPKAKINAKYTLTENLWNYLQAYAAKHAAAGHGFGFGLVKPGVDRHTRTLSARYHKDGSEILIYQGKRKRPRRLTPRECARLMGFPESFEIPVSDTQAYRQFGNSVVVPVIAEVARIMAPRIMELKQAEIDGVRQQPLLVA